jgi:hypothetical protein
VNESLLVNALGHSAGILIFGIFLYLMIQDRARHGRAGASKPMLAAALAIGWNLASLIALRPSPENNLGQAITVALGFSVLSLLPAVLFDLCLENRERWLVGLGYLLSAVAVAMHLAEIFVDGEVFHRWGLILITAGFGVLTGLAAVLSVIRPKSSATSGTPRLIGTMLLFLLAMSFVHFRGAHPAEAWSQELAFHHAAIPLALLILLQDYRFVLLDAFVRFLANVFLAAVFVFAGVELWRLEFFQRQDAPFPQALFLAVMCLGLVMFAFARSALERVLTRLVFRQADEAALMANLRETVRDEEEYLRRAASLVGQHEGAQGSLSEGAFADLAGPALISETRGADYPGVEVIVPLRIARKPRAMFLARRSGGRRYLSQDLATLGRAASVIADQIEQFRDAELRRLVTQAELRALQSQIHPHFLFNALNALYGIIPRGARSAREMVLNLSDIFRYTLETGKMMRPFSDELRIIRAYLEVERLRLGEKLRVELEIAPEALDVAIPVLSIQPLVENAIKHGIAPKIEGGKVRVEAVVLGGALRIGVTDSGAGYSSAPKGSGVGLENVARRLDLCYGSQATLDIASGPEGTRASVIIPASTPVLEVEAAG